MRKPSILIVYNYKIIRIEIYRLFCLYVTLNYGYLHVNIEITET